SCNPIAMIVMVVVAVVVTYFTAGAAGPAFASAFGATGAGIGTAAGVGISTASAAGFIAGAAVGAAAGSAASQLVGKALGVVDDFSWKQVALSGLAGGVTAGMTTALNLGALSIPGEALGEGLTRSAVSYGTRYLGSKALGVDTSFSWTNLAASAASAIASVGSANLTSDIGVDIISDTINGFVGS
ncbi:hypothetical protein, partial [Enterovibrio calviensis]|uniref:hypothetical protein n=1 Tax=Enterovibrio norvegicus TaxID=188144 RepID=UPI000584B1DF